MSEDSEIINSFGKLCLHKRSRLGVIRDFIISFNEKQDDIESVVNKTYELFEQLVNRFKDNYVKARLIAQVNYQRFNDKHEVVEEEDFHFASHGSEHVQDIHDFYSRHMCKIASRMDSFHERGSRLVINCIKHIHIQLAVCHSA